jgi:uncharacterized protein YndB with AHSA1/START domain
VRREATATVVIHAPAEAIWAVVGDVTRVGQWSGECRGGAWAPGTAGLEPGAEFWGHNRRGWLRWTRLNRVISVEAPRRLVWRTLPRGPYPDSVEWTIELAQAEAGTAVTESFSVLKLPRLMDWAISVTLPPHRDRTDDLLADLGRLKALVEGERAGVGHQGLAVPEEDR